MKRYIKTILPAAAMILSLGLPSCSSDLDVTPIDPNLQTKERINSDNLLNKCYANLAVAGNSGPDGDCDIDGLDGGTTGFVRQMFNANELTTDEAICAWGDPGIENFNFNTYDAQQPMLRGFYYRLYAGISYCNQYIADFGAVDAQKTAEARFLRALQYYLLLDGWGNVPFTTAVSSEKPQQIKRADLYKWVESELLDVQNDLAEAKPEKKGEEGYGRVDKAAAWLLLARLYLNAEVYTGTPEWGKAAEYAKKVIDSPFKLYTTKKGNWSPYQQLFMGDNGINGASQECIFSVIQDGEKTHSYGTTLFLIASTTNATEIVNPDGKSVGMNTTEKWSGNRARPDLIKKFFPQTAPQVDAYQMTKEAKDDRAIFTGNGRELENNDPSTFTDGYGVCKFNNWYTTGTAKNTKFPDTDFFFFRSAEAYLIYAEATARANGGTATAEGVGYLNQLRSRANASTKAGYTLDDICDEWSREFYFEGIRRPTLIRFGKFGGNTNYNWTWKGGAKNGRNIDKHYNLFAIPSSDLNANGNLQQNEGYKDNQK